MVVTRSLTVDPREFSLTKSFKELSPQEKLDKKAYKIVLYRLNKKENSPFQSNGKTEYNNENSKRMKD